MRVALVTRAFRARSPFDPLTHVRSLAPALARAGLSVEVFCGTRGSGLPPLSQRRQDVPDHASGASFGVTTVELGGVEPGGRAGRPDARGPRDLERTAGETADRVAAAFGAFLDRERPDVVHFEHLDAFGAALVGEVEARGIASVLSASDVWPAQDRPGSTLPDLTPMELGDAEAEARAELAEAELGPVPASGRFDDADRSARLRELLHEPLAEMADVLRLREARERVEARRAAKRAALSRIDRRFAVTRALAKDLSAAVGRAFTFRAAGVDTSLFEPAEGGAPDREAIGPGRAFAFVGTSAPIEGVDVLLDAFAEARAAEDAPAMSLTLHLEAGDARRDAEVARRAEAVGANTRWTRGPADVAVALRSADVLVVPARFGQVTSPLPRAAVAVGRPVVLSRIAGLVEEVPPDAARTVPPGHVEDLTAELLRLGGDGELAEDLARSAADAATRVKSCDDEVREWLDTYRQIAPDAPARRGIAGTGLAHVADVARSLEELRRLSVSELFARAQEGLGRLRKAFGSEEDTEAILRRVVARGGEARDRAQELDALRGDIRESLDALVEARDAADRAEAGRAIGVSALAATLERFEREAQARGEDAARAAAELRAADDGDLERAERARRLTAADALDGARERFEALAREATRGRTALGDADAERARFAAAIRGRDDLLAALRDRVAAPEEGASEAPALAARARDLDGIEAFCVALEQDVRALRAHDDWLAATADALAGALTGDAADERAEYERVRARLDALCVDLARRAADLVAAREAGASLRERVLAGPLAARMRGWERAATGRHLEVPDDRRGELRPAGGMSGAPEESGELEPAEPGPSEVRAADAELDGAESDRAGSDGAGPGGAEPDGDHGRPDASESEGPRESSADETMARKEGAR